MCGIAGIVSTAPREDLAVRLAAMIAAQRHRGPDGEGQWVGRVGNCMLALGHVRLAILDLSDAGKQPMLLADGNSLIIFNGEIYNYRELRGELEGHGARFRTQTDTEVLLWALRVWGDAALARLNGMWAFAWLDFSTRRLVLSRDRFGIKPLHYFHDGRSVWFASEVKGILAGARRRFALNHEAAGSFVTQSLLDVQPQTFFEGIRTLAPGHSASFDLNEPPAREPTVTAYWHAPRADNFAGTEQQRIGAVRETFLDAVRLRLRSDVPVGVLLSGGVDSSAIAAAMRELLGPQGNLRLLAATSDNLRYGERPFMEIMARHLRSPISFVKLDRSPQEWWNLLGDVIHANEQPVGNFSTAAHFLLMQEARQLGITVILSGQGADELLCGYSKFLGFRVQELLRRRRPLKAAGLVAGFLRNRTVINQFDLREAQRYMGGLLRFRAIDVRGPRLRDGGWLDIDLGGRTLVERQREDLERFSVPALVHYEDRCSMAWGREIRLPFLDYRLVNLILPADPDVKLRAGWTKWVFRKAMEPFLPPAIAWRKDKQYFLNPQGEWLRKELEPTVSRLLKSEMLIVDAGLIKREALIRRYDAYCRRRGRGAVSFNDVFNPIALELWARRFEDSLALG
ncbi:MAG TPA: asparagine synthase (glutamine-hydrolyzing) [Candidatus Binataceae bacterium]|jgi:asparagine synthase (glutamine-hydrolysing)|nr:asparagine synthase (glutamine-hydrolyzing) [Candidatus Binataceae bacterium]